MLVYLEGSQIIYESLNSAANQYLGYFSANLYSSFDYSDSFKLVSHHQLV